MHAFSPPMTACHSADCGLLENPKTRMCPSSSGCKGYKEMLVPPRKSNHRARMFFLDPKLTSIVLATEFALPWLCGYPMQATRINWVLLRQSSSTLCTGCSWRPPRTATVSGLGAQTEDPAGVAVAVLLSIRLKTRVLQGRLAKEAPTTMKRITEGRYSRTPWLLWSSSCFCLLL